MKKNNLYIALAAAGGLLIGYLIFGALSGEPGTTQHDHSQEMASGAMWTCSMHPQIMQPEPGDCPICGMDLIPSESGEQDLPGGQFRMTKNALALAGVRTTKVGSAASGGNTLKLSGKITENEKAVGTQASYFDGRIEKLFVNFEGEEVRSGQLLATLYAPDLVSAQQELITAAGLKTNQPQLYQAVRNKLKLWKLSEKQIQEIETSGRVQENFPVYATVSGTVSEIMVQAGDYVKTGAPLFRIANLGTVWAVFDAYENQVSLIKEGQTIEITAKAYPETPFQAGISFINPVLNTSTRTTEVRVILQNSGGRLKPGMFVSGTLKLAEKTEIQALVIPESAVLWTGERSVVYVKTDPGSPVFEMREIAVGDVVNEGYLVLSGLEHGDEIVTQGTFTVDAAAQLKGKNSMMNEEGGRSMTGHEGHMPNAGAGASDTGADLKELTFPESYTKDFAAIVPPYLKMKDALVAGSTATVQIQAMEMAGKLSTINTAGLGEMERSSLESSQNRLEAIGNSEALEAQRDHFVMLNESLIPVLKAVGNGSGTLYVQTCPMANNNKGAIWLSAEKEIRNPYYGNDMLECGRVISTIQ
jgi:Cu(I)/Ag(I) efflux system membrane fusion protein